MTTRRRFVQGAAATAALASMGGWSVAMASDKSPVWKSSDKAAQFLKDIIAIDSLNANLMMTASRPEMWEEYYGRAHEAGITAFGVTAVQGIMTFDDAAKEMSQQLERINRDDRFVLVRTAEDIRRAHKNGQVGFFWNAQGSESLMNKPNVYMPVLREMGVGTMLLAYNERMRGGDGNYVLNPGPISTYGKRVVEAMHKNRVIVDTSHASEPTALTTIEYSQKLRPDLPTIETHGSVHALYSGYPEGEIRLRTCSDERIQAVAATGGAVAITMLPFILISPETEVTRPKDVVDRIDYIKNLTSIDAVALSSDDAFDWRLIYAFANANPDSYDDGGITKRVNQIATSGVAECAKIYAAIIDEMWKRGYSDEAVKKVLGGNLMRVYERVWG